MENLVAGHLSRITPNGHQSPLKEDFPDEHLFFIAQDYPWYADIVNYLVTKTFPGELTRFEKDKIKKESHFYVWDEPYLWKHCPDQVIRRCVPQQEFQSVLQFCHSSSYGGHFGHKMT